MQTTIRSLHKKGYSNAYIARTLGVSRNTVSKVIKSEERGGIPIPLAGRDGQ